MVSQGLRRHPLHRHCQKFCLSLDKVFLYPDPKTNPLHQFLLTFSLSFFPVCLINVDVASEAKIRDFTDLVQGQKHVAGCQVAVDQLQLA